MLPTLFKFSDDEEEDMVNVVMTGTAESCFFKHNK